MMVMVKVVVVVVVMLGEVHCYDEANTVRANRVLEAYEKELLVALHNSTTLFWTHLEAFGNYDFPTKRDVELSLMSVKGKYQKDILHYLDRRQRVRMDTRRRLLMAASGQLNETESLGVHMALSSMAKLYDTAKSCSPSATVDVNVCQMVPGNAIGAFMEELNTGRLIQIWEGWHSNMSEKLRPNFTGAVAYLNKAARAVGKKDHSEEMLKSYEGHLSKRDLLGLYLDIEELYQLLHSYVRRNLHLRFPNVTIDTTKAIPVTLLGDLFGRFWGSLYHYIKPYRSVLHEEANITSYMERVRQNYTWMYRWVEERYLSMGLRPLPPNFFEESALKGAKEDQKTQDCRPSAWEMYDSAGKDYRIYMCTEVTEEHLQTIIHLVGHIQYYQHYYHQPLLFRQGANEAFHDAISGMFALAFSSPIHIYGHGFPGVDVTEPPTREREINYLFRVALALLPSVPYLLGLDVWRWKVYEGVYKPQDWNCEYWKLRQLYSGVIPTTYRNATELDMLPTYQLAHTATATRHYTAIFLQFMILESLCYNAGHRGPLHSCDLYWAEKAGRILAEAMHLGSSRPWPEVLQVLTGADHMSAAPLKRYFQPLTEWLKEDARKAGGRGGVGWGSSWRLLGGGAAGYRRWQGLYATVVPLLTLPLTHLLLLLPQLPPPPRV